MKKYMVNYLSKSTNYYMIGYVTGDIKEALRIMDRLKKVSDDVYVINDKGVVVVRHSDKKMIA